MKVTVTEDHVKRALELDEDDRNFTRSACCPNTLAVLEALGLEFSENYGCVFTDSEDVRIASDERISIALLLPEPALALVRWYDEMRDIPLEPRLFPRPEFPITYELAIPTT